MLSIDFTSKKENLVDQLESEGGDEMVVLFDPFVHFQFRDCSVVSPTQIFRLVQGTSHPFSDLMALVTVQTLLDESPCGCPCAYLD